MTISVYSDRFSHVFVLKTKHKILHKNDENKPVNIPSCYITFYTPCCLQYNLKCYYYMYTHMRHTLKLCKSLQHTNLTINTCNNAIFPTTLKFHNTNINTHVVSTTHHPNYVPYDYCYLVYM
jgi:hypothetical protein